MGTPLHCLDSGAGRLSRTRQQSVTAVVVWALDELDTFTMRIAGLWAASDKVCESLLGSSRHHVQSIVIAAKPAIFLHCSQGKFISLKNDYNAF